MTDLHEIYEAQAGGMPLWNHPIVVTRPIVLIDPTAKVHQTSAVWHGARILGGVVIGHNCSIGGGTEIGRGSRIGNYSRIGANCFLPPNSVVGNEVFIGPSVSMADDRHPRIHVAGDAPYTPEPPVIEDGAIIGLGAVLLPGVHIGARAVVGAGAIVCRDVPPGGHVRSEPARTKSLSHASSQAFTGASA